MRRKILGCGVIVAALLSASLSFASEPTTTTAVPHVFVPGQRISADMLNENFAAIKPDLAETLIGTWSTECWDAGLSDPTAPSTGTLTIAAGTNGTLNAVSMTDTVCLGGIHTGYTTAFNGTYTIDLITPLSNHALQVNFHNVSGSFTTTSHRLTSVLELEPSHMQFLLHDTGSEGSDSIEAYSRLDGPPANPHNLTVSATNGAVTLSWTDRSSDETSFRVLRKFSASGTLDGTETFATVGTADANATTYQETLTTVGTYWYRVQAVGANGASLGTNLVIVTVQ